ncbi:protein-glutamate methylesterase/protein-glutamine glutaminase [Sediminibacillus albus]|uniref:Protein-glutamate methylesterase/protein-glutamine glutaminase n=1 Tax=Sediminibacillus albus TaxID=407036 RepID=A0A1G8W2T7_9BACI|nr:chemotaxis response regulator protein-glutamate methylesterase [Sediminibacillus albus]SDJ72045.1 two-component system, chemotaxis family, response regulator CheB [Sediminibacillus albus]
MEPIRVLVVDDSAFMRKMISDILNSDSRLHVVATARNGREALEKNKQLSPHVITLDIEMPVLNGIETLKQVMKENPVPVVMLSSLTKQGADSTLEAMSLGAVDFIAKPSGSISLDIKKVEKEIINKVIEAAGTKAQAGKAFTSRKDIQVPKLVNLPGKHELKRVVAIGTSTGGPKALHEVLTQLPENFPAPIVVVQHMPPNFTKSLANRLDSLSQIHIKEAENGEVLQNGTAYIAPGGFQFRVRQVGRSLAAHVTDEDPVRGHRPSVDIMFESLAEQQLFQIVALVMTGMGADGSAGISKMKEVKNDTIVIAESKQTSVVYGMPLAAVNTGKVDYIENLENISGTLVQQLLRHGGN